MEIGILEANFGVLAHFYLGCTYGLSILSITPQIDKYLKNIWREVQTWLETWLLSETKFFKIFLILMTLVAKWTKTKWCKKFEEKKGYWNDDAWVLIQECSARATQWIPTWQGLYCFKKSLCPWFHICQIICILKLSIG